MKQAEFTVEAKNLEQVKVVFPKDRRQAVMDYLRKNGWYIGRSGDGRVKGTLYMVAVREETMHSTAELLDEVNSGIARL